MAQIIKFPESRIVRYLDILREYGCVGGVIKKLFVRLPGQSEWEQWVQYGCPDTDETFWGPWSLGEG